MRHFYEAKLIEMEKTLNEKEREREDLMHELDQIEVSKEHESLEKIAAMKEELRVREIKIAALKTKQAELRNLTQVSSRNEKHMGELKSEVIMMKKQRVELQKKIMQERKVHMNEMKTLKLETSRLNREATKLRHESSRKSQQLESAQRLARTRLEEASRVRSKYREVEKQLRMQTFKRGVMARAGIDGILTGRQSGGERTSSSSYLKKLRNFFDEKVILNAAFFSNNYHIC